MSQSQDTVIKGTQNHESHLSIMRSTLRWRGGMSFRTFYIGSGAFDCFQHACHNLARCVLLVRSHCWPLFLPACRENFRRQIAFKSCFSRMFVRVWLSQVPIHLYVCHRKFSPTCMAGKVRYQTAFQRFCQQHAKQSIDLRY